MKISQIEEGSTGNITLHAKWNPVTYTIKYNLNGGKNHTSNPSSYTINSPTVNLKSPSKHGYSFGGWYSESTLTNKKKFPPPSPLCQGGSQTLKRPANRRSYNRGKRLGD